MTDATLPADDLNLVKMECRKDGGSQKGRGKASVSVVP